MPIATAQRIYTIQVALLMLCYVVVLCISLRAIPLVSDQRIRILIALTPVVPIVFVLGSMIQLLSRVDEMWRRIHLEAAALAAGMTAMLAATCGFLQNVGMPPLSGFWTFGALDVFYVISVLFLRWRYR